MVMPKCVATGVCPLCDRPVDDRRNTGLKEEARWVKLLLHLADEHNIIKGDFTKYRWVCCCGHEGTSVMDSLVDHFKSVDLEEHLTLGILGSL